MGCVEGWQPRNSIEFVQSADVIQPIGTTLWVSGHAQYENENVKSRGYDKGNRENAEHVGVLELILRGRMRNALESDKSPRREEGDAHDLLERILFGHEGWLHRHIGAAMT